MPSSDEVPPPGVGVVTVTVTLPVVAISAAVIAAVICVPLTKVVVRGLPFHCTTDAASNPVPVTVKVKPAPPTVTVAGDKELTAGTGFVSEILTAEEVPPPGVALTTVTGTLPAEAISAAVIAAVNSFAL
jgi:hypothetical protein